MAASEASGMATKERMYGATAADESIPLTPGSQSVRDSHADDSQVERMQAQKRRYTRMQLAVAGIGALAVAGTLAFSGSVAGDEAASIGGLTLEESVKGVPETPSAEANDVAADSGTDADDSIGSMYNGMQAQTLVASYDVDEDGLFIPSTDPNATKATRALLTALVDVANTDSIMFGHENTNLEGQYFWDEYGNQGHSDVTNATGGGFPSVVGYNVEQILTGQNWTAQVHEAYARGSVITFFWSASNPVNGGSSLNCGGHPMKNLLPGGTGNGNWTMYLDTIGGFFNDLKFNGEHIPIIFRIFHECTGSWYWWGEECAHPSEYIDAWVYTQQYLRDVVGVHNLLYIYAPSKPSDTFHDSYDTWWPGDDAVDIIGFDRYSKETLYPTNVLADCQNVSSLALKKGKVVALGETGIADGIQGVDNSTWWLHDFVNVFMNDPLCSKMSYALTFANESPDRYWVPLKGNPTHPSFVDFFQSDKSIFAGDSRWTTLMQLYGFGPLGTGNDVTHDDGAAPSGQTTDDGAAPSGQTTDDGAAPSAPTTDDDAAAAAAAAGIPDDDAAAAANTDASAGPTGQAVPPSAFIPPSP